jgi:class 3 adenylate cyclase
VSCGVLAPDKDNFLSLLKDHDQADSAARVLAFAKDMHAAAASVCMPGTGEPVRIRVGIHTGARETCDGESVNAGADLVSPTVTVGEDNLLCACIHLEM